MTIGQNVKMTNDNWPKFQMIIGQNIKWQLTKMSIFQMTICQNVEMPNDNWPKCQNAK